MKTVSPRSLLDTFQHMEKPLLCMNKGPWRSGFVRNRWLILWGVNSFSTDVHNVGIDNLLVHGTCGKVANIVYGCDVGEHFFVPLLVARVKAIKEMKRLPRTNKHTLSVGSRHPLSV